MASLSTAEYWLVVATALGAATIGGIFFAFSTFIMRAFAERPASEGMAAMASINRVIVRSLFMPVFFGTAVLALVLGVYRGIVWIEVSGLLLGGAVLYLVGCIFVTMAFNVPLNNALERAGSGAEGEALWRDYLVRWTRWNSLRTWACFGSALLLIRALIIA